MTNERKQHARGRPGLSRREVLVGAAAAVIAAGTGSVAAASPGQRARHERTMANGAPVLRYMAAAAVLGDGRVLITGGYDRPFDGGSGPTALASAVVYDPVTGQYRSVTPMRVPRARHAAVPLQDGRVAVLGGIGIVPTASVEVYDPDSDSWHVSTPLAQPRYDHVAVTDGTTVFVFGGSAQGMLASAESVTPGSTRGF
jgi:hypothetical protein